MRFVQPCKIAPEFVPVCEFSQSNSMKACLFNKDKGVQKMYFVLMFLNLNLKKMVGGTGLEPVPTLTTGFLTPGRGRFIHPEFARTLTPGEAAFVQGFPAWFNFDCADNNRTDYSKWIGDAVPMPLAYVASLSVLEAILNDEA